MSITKAHFEKFCKANGVTFEGRVATIFNGRKVEAPINWADWIKALSVAMKHVEHGRERWRSVSRRNRQVKRRLSIYEHRKRMQADEYTGMVHPNGEALS